MVVKKSEYQKQYKACIIKKHQAAYLENLNLRLQRRDREFLHTPICWEEVSDEEEKVSSDCSEEEQTKSTKTQSDREPEYQSLADILYDSRKKAESARKQKILEGFKGPSDIANGITGEGKQPTKAGVPFKIHDDDEQKQTEAVCLSKKDFGAIKSNLLSDSVGDEKKPNKKFALPSNAVPYVDNKNLPEDRSFDTKPEDMLLREDTTLSAVKNTEQRLAKISKQKKDKKCEGFNKMNPAAPLDRHIYCSQRPNVTTESFVPPLTYLPRVRRPHRQPQARRPQPPVDRAKSTPVSPEPAVKERPPFIAYGIGDKEESLATHRTHNVRASVDVYPLALRAKTRRQEQHRRQTEKLHRARSTEAMLEKLSARTQDLDDWESEYRKQFHGYEPRDYKKSMANHAVIPRSTPVQAVHRGGCLFVNVD